MFSVLFDFLLLASTQHAVSSFDWHPSEENRLLTVTPGGIIKDIKIFERIALVSAFCNEDWYTFLTVLM